MATCPNIESIRDRLNDEYGHTYKILDSTLRLICKPDPKEMDKLSTFIEWVGVVECTADDLNQIGMLAELGSTYAINRVVERLEYSQWLEYYN